MYFVSKSNNASYNAYVKIAILETGSSEIMSVMNSTVGTTYPATTQKVELDMSSGLTNGELYEVEISTWSSSGSGLCYLRSDVIINVTTSFTIY